MPFSTICGSKFLPIRKQAKRFSTLRRASVPAFGAGEDFSFPNKTTGYSAFLLYFPLHMIFLLQIIINIII